MASNVIAGKLGRASIGIILLAMIAVMLFIPNSSRAAIQTYTTDADFDLGTLQAVNHDSPNSDQLQISATTSTFPVMWIANAGEDTLSKLDTDTGRELARYETWFSSGFHGAWSGPAPSRTAVDSSGNVYVLNRHFDGKPSQVMKILATGGIDRNGNAVIDTSTDADASGVIEPGEIIPLVDTNLNGLLDAAELVDERVAWAIPVGPPGAVGRSLCIAPDGGIWVGQFYTSDYYQISPLDGSPISGPHPIGVTPYGCAVDGSSTLWSANLGSALGELDTVTKVKFGPHPHPGSNYGIAIGNGKVYLGGNCSYIQYDPGTGLFSNPAATPTCGTGIAVDSAGNIITGNNVLVKSRPDGTTVWSAAYSATYAHGIVVDNNDHIWGVNLYANTVTKWNGATGAVIGTYPVGRSPYTYSDATGLSALTSTPTGVWTATHDGGTAGTEWGTISWNQEAEGNVPAGATLTVQVRSADTVPALDFATYTTVTTNGTPLPSSIFGRYIQVKVTFQANSSGVSPVLSDLTIEDIASGGPTCDGLPATIVGTPGNDNINGTPGDDVIVGLAGEDNIDGKGGNDVICGNEDRDQLKGGDGNDRIFGNEGPDRIWGQNGDDFIVGDEDDDVIYGGDGDDTLRGKDGNDRIKGDNGNDLLKGGEGDDTLDGKAGKDQLFGEKGNDRLYGGDNGDYIEGNAGDDVAYGGNGDDEIYGNDGNDRLKGEGGDDFISGGLDDDTLQGGDGDDKLKADEGNDRLYGGDGNDDMAGHDGNDTFYGGNGDDSIAGHDGNDNMRGEAGTDSCDGGPGAADSASTCEIVLNVP